MNKFQRILLFLFLVLAGIGMEFELGSLSQQEFSQVAGRDLVLNLLVLAVIVVPLYLFIKRLAKRFEGNHVWRCFCCWLAQFFREQPH